MIRHLVSNNFLRHLEIFKYLNSYGQSGRTIRQVTEYLNKVRGYSVSRRTIERDMKELSDMFHFTVVDHHPSLYILEEMPEITIDAFLNP